MSEDKAAYMWLLCSARRSASSGCLKWLSFAPDKRHQLLVYLAYSGDWVGRKRLAYLFWPDTRHERAQQNLRGLLHRVRYGARQNQRPRGGGREILR